MPVSTSASRQILSTQTCEVCTRPTSVLKVKVGQRASKPARKLTSCEQVRPVKPSPQAQVANTADDVEVNDDGNVTVYKASDMSQAANVVAGDAVCNLDHVRDVIIAGQSLRVVLRCRALPMSTPDKDACFSP